MRSVGYRLVYEVDDKRIIVLVLAIGKRNRNEVYNKLFSRI
ncbi:plasmid stabilization system family protein [Rickettsia felis str. Pedreira]|uniref:Plasmid stabilization system family protein n=2 Tax=Rickettsia felis TaxID=42862 RepID=A0A0F3MSG8_RICFI|nr:Cytotoxic translational repressor of toxin-antitoxin system RelE [Rickettsia felis URRWXCal2]KJV58591.1 plasmid stabilization system family protein [Rickettsia felis str. Pedreira]